MRRGIPILGLAIVGAFSGGCDRKIAGGVADGPKIYALACAQCHGERGQPTAQMMANIGVKPLNSAAVRDGLSDAQIRSQVQKGSQNRNMPAFGNALTADQIDAVVAHVRTFAPKPR